MLRGFGRTGTMMAGSDIISGRISITPSDMKPARTEKSAQEINVIHDISDLFEETSASQAASAVKEDECSKFALRDRLADSKAVPLGLGLFMANKTLGPNVVVHEYGHLYADRLMYNDCRGFVQADSVENLEAFLQKPSADSFKKLMLEYDINGNGNRGYYMPMERGEASGIGKNLTAAQREVVVDAAGSIAECIPSFAAFTSGFMLRKKHPLMGYTLMTFGLVSHMRSSLYPLAAVIPGVQALGGSDWVCISKNSGVNPAIPAALYAASLPLLALGLYSIEKIREGRSKDRIALANLIGNQGITADELQKAFDQYSDKCRLSAAEEKAFEALNAVSCKSDKSVSAGAGKAGELLEKEYGRFSDYLIGKYRDRVDAELPNVEKELPKMSISGMLSGSAESVKASWRNDKAGTALGAGSMAASAAVLGASTLSAAGDMVCAAKGITPEAFPELSTFISGATGSLGRVLAVALPIAGVAGLASTCYSAGKVLRDRSASDADKVASVASTVFAGIGTAGLFIPAFGLPLILTGIAGQVGTWAGKAIYDRIARGNQQ
jgi:hypothetical protein